MKMLAPARQVDVDLDELEELEYFPPQVAPGKVNTAHRLYRRAASDDHVDPQELAGARADARASSGQPLPSPLLQKFREQLGYDFTNVRVHTDDAAARASQRIQAEAFTQGSNIYFDQGRFDASQTSGDGLLLHELGHVVQHTTGDSSVTGGLSKPGDSMERGADAFADWGLSQMLAPGPVRSEKATAIPRAENASTVSRFLGPNSKPKTSQDAKAREGQGKHEGRAVGTWGFWSKSTITAFSTIGDYDSQAAAEAVCKAAGGAVRLEDGRYFAYTIHPGSFVPFKYAYTKKTSSDRASTVTATDALSITTNDGVTLSGRGSGGGSKQLSAEKLLTKGDSPFVAHKEAHQKGLANIPGKSRFAKAFAAAMKDNAMVTLNKSEQEVKRKRHQYNQGKGESGVSDRESELIQATAKRVAATDVELIDLDKKIEVSDSKARPSGRRAADTGRTDPVAAEKSRELRKQRRAVVAKRNMALADYPLLRTVDCGKLAALQPEQVCKALGNETRQLLTNIHRSKKRVLTGSLNLWGMSQIVDSTIAGLGIDDPGRRAWIAEEVTAKKQWAAIEEGIITAFSVGLGIVASVATGGVALAASAGALGLGVYDAARASEQTAATNDAAETAIDPLEGLLEPKLKSSWGWVVLAWASLGLDVADVASALKAVAKGSVPNSKQVGKLAVQLAGGDDTLAKNLRLAARLEDATTVDITMVSSLSKQLGAPVKINPDLDKSIQVHYKITDRGPRVTEVVLGANAEVGDVLAHAGVIKSIERYNGLFGKVRELRDRFVSRFGGKEAVRTKLEKGSKAWEAYFEVEKLPALIEKRREALFRAGRATKQDEAAIRAEIAYMERELARHKRTLAAGRSGKSSGEAAGHIDQKLENATGKAAGKDAPADAAEEAREQAGKARWAEVKGSYGGTKDEAGFVQKYRDGYVYEGNRWRSPNKGPETFFDDTWTAQEVFNHLTAGNRSFAPFLASLKKFGLVKGDAEIVTLIGTSGFKDMSEKAVRHKLKAEYKLAVFMQNSDPKKLKELYPDTFKKVKGKKSDPIREASHRHITAFTAGLNEADRGNMMEHWYNTVFVRGDTHKGVRKGKDAGKVRNLELDRRSVDIYDRNGVAHEVKSTNEGLSARDRSQLEDYKKMRGKELENSKGKFFVRELNYVFTSPRGGWASIKNGDAQRILDHGGRVVLFNTKGQRMVVGDPGQLQNATKAWFGIE